MARGSAPPEPAPAIWKRRSTAPVRRPDVEPGSIQKAKKKPDPKRKAKGESTPRPQGGGVKKFPLLKTAKEVREYILAETDVLENLCRMASGKRIRLLGPSGKIYWHDTSFEDVKWAISQLLPRFLPTLASQELTGDSDRPLQVEGKLEGLGDPNAELARRSIILLEALGVREVVEQALEAQDAANGTALPPGGAQERRNGSAPSRTPEPIDVTPEPSEAVERAAEETPSIRGVGSGEEIRKRELIPEPQWVLHLGLEIEVRNHGNIHGRANTGNLYSVVQGGREVLKPQGWVMVEKKLDRLLEGRELPYSLIPVRPGQRAGEDAPDQRSWLGKLRGSR